MRGQPVIEPGQPIIINKSDIEKINGFGIWPNNDFRVNANIKGYEPLSWFSIPIYTDAALKEAAAKGVTLGDIVDEWNDRLRALEPEPLISWTFTSASAEQAEAIKKLFGLE